MSDDFPWEPPSAGTEEEHLLGALNRLRATFRFKAGGLDAGGLNARIPSSTLTLGGLLKHLAVIEDYYFTVKMSGEPLGSPWEAYEELEGDWDFDTAVDDSPAELYALYDGALERSAQRLGAALATGGLDQIIHVGRSEGMEFSLRRLVFDLVEEYGRHTGHADILREAVDGVTGEDPPAGWQP